MVGSNMGTRLLLGLLAVLLAASFCCSSAESQAERSVFVSGKSECLDCAEKNVKPEHAYQGIDACGAFCFAPSSCLLSFSCNLETNLNACHDLKSSSNFD